ncbi:hypothetical protein CCYA_CCYA15G3930 [Cyanidiococcus yangmingshanensis]|nr:hypothetical protein CCYA_CCYA15G3930 [Cyanidiococcus yangmingshanensis]
MATESLRDLLFSSLLSKVFLPPRAGIYFGPIRSRSIGYRRNFFPLKSCGERKLSTTHSSEAKCWRGDYAQLEKADIEALAKLADVSKPTTLPSKRSETSSVCITSADQLRSYNTDWTGQFHGNSQLCLRPSNAEAVAAILSYCNQKKLAVTPQGGNTGLVGGSVPVFDEIILSMSRMNRILGMDEEHGIVTVEAGVPLSRVDSFCRERGFSFPLDLGAKDSCQIGGNLATNAGGSRYIRYGSLHGTVLGLEVVLADGTVLDLGSGKRIRKDNTGYDLKHLFIGSEGTLGVITKATFACYPAPLGTQVAFVGITGDFARVRHWLMDARRDLAEHLRAFEVMDAEAMMLHRSYSRGFRDPFREPHSFYILIETSTGITAETAASTPLETWLEKMIRSHERSDVIIAQDLTQSAQFWQLRESLPEMVRQSGPSVLKYDLSLPLTVFYDIVEVTRERLRQEALDAHVYAWGHVADGNLHLNISGTAPKAILHAALEPWLYEWTLQRGGSCSAEHGIGLLKSHLLARSKGTVTLGIMERLKAVLDPNGILNPYKLFKTCSRAE